MSTVPACPRPSPPPELRARRWDGGALGRGRYGDVCFSSVVVAMPTTRTPLPRVLASLLLLLLRSLPRLLARCQFRPP